MNTTMTIKIALSAEGGPRRFNLGTFTASIEIPHRTKITDAGYQKFVIDLLRTSLADSAKSAGVTVLRASVDHEDIQATPELENL